jgi:hypothetical protein
VKPSTLRRLHAALTVLWLLIAVPGILLWRDSVPFLVGVSIYANFVGHFSSWQAARAEEAVA